MGTRNRSEKLLAAHTRVLDVNSKISEGCKLQVPCHAQSPGTQSLLAPQEQVLPRTGIPSSVIQYLGKEIQRAASTASSLLLVENHQGWWLGQVKAWDRDVYYDQYFVRFHDDPGPSQVLLAKEFYTTDVDGVPGSWCLQSHVREGIFRDADMSRDDDFQES